MHVISQVIDVCPSEDIVCLRRNRTLKANRTTGTKVVAKLLESSMRFVLTFFLLYFYLSSLNYIVLIQESIQDLHAIY